LSALNEVTFRGAILKNVSIRAIKVIYFDGAIMDKLTYAALKGMEADLSKVTII
jgi:hypothetical protein